VVQGRTVVLCDSSWFLNTGSCIFHLVAARNLGRQGGARKDKESSVCKLLLV
jgi:hypothetical protein